MKNILVLAVSACAVCAFGAATKDFYVSTNDLHEVDGVVWGTYVTEDGVAHNAYTNLQQAITANGKSGNTIWVEDGFVCDVGGETAAGTGSRITTPYIDGVDKFIIRSRSGEWETGAEIRGRYHSEEEPCGVNSIRCVAPGCSAKFVGFRLVGGSTTGNGGGVVSGMYGATLENCLIENCVAKGSGGGFYKDYSRAYTAGLSSRMINCVVRNNRALGGNGGGVNGAHMISCQVYGNSCNGSGGGLSHSQVTEQGYLIVVSNCVFYGNTASAGSGGGVYIYDYNSQVYECVISNNTASAKGGGLYTSEQKSPFNQIVRTYNLLVVGNTAGGAGGGIYGGVHTGALVARNTAASAGGVSASYNAGLHARLINCTVTDNTITGKTAPYEAEYVALTNSVVWSNKSGTIAVASNVKDSSHSCWPTATEGTADCNTAQNPKLWTLGGKAYAAIAVSCRGQGETFDWMTDGADICSKDWYGDPRILGDEPDMGWVSMEAKTGVICRSADFGPSLGMVGSIFSLTASVDTVKAGATYDFHWTLTDLEGVERRFVGTEEVLNQMIADPGDYKVSLVVSNHDDPDDFDIGILTDRLLVLPLTNYVTSVAGATPVFPYARPETAAISVYDALDCAVDGATIVFDAGVHAVTKEIAVNRKLTLVGAGREATVLRAGASASKMYRVMTLNHAEAVVRDLTLTGGFTSGDNGDPYHGSAGIDIRSKGGSVINCAIIGNTLSGGGSGRNGGAISIFNKDALVDRCIIAFNTNYHSAAGNKSVGIVYMNAGTVRNSIIRNNFLDGVGSAGSGHVVDMSGNVCRLENCTILDNEDRFPDGCAVCMTGSYLNTPYMYNTILSGNTAPNAAIPEGSPLPNLRAPGASYYYDVKKCFFVGSAAFDANSYVGTDAKFVDAAAGDYRLQLDSPCRNKGRNDDWMADALDVYGKPRLAGRKVDIGAAETESGLMLMIR